MKIYTGENCGELIRRSGFEDKKIASAVHTIVEDVKRNGDRALFACEEKFDKTILTAETVRVGEKEFEEAYRAIDPALLESIRRAKERILNYHMRGATEGDVRTDEKGRTTGYLLRPVERAGIYVPGGTAPLFSSVCMGILPAKAAGVEHIYMATPAKEGKIHPATLVAAKECGAEAVFKMGGAQAIAAFAYGTESVPKTDVIAGPGNIYVTLAKKEVYGAVGIDMLAGPSEILIIADGAADVEYVAADMLSQAEHDERARAIVLTDDSVFAGILAAEVARQCALLPRKKTAQTSLDTNGGIVLVKDMKEAAAIADKSYYNERNAIVVSERERVSETLAKFTRRTPTPFCPSFTTRARCFWAAVRPNPSGTTSRVPTTFSPRAARRAFSKCSIGIFSCAR